MRQLSIILIGLVIIQHSLAQNTLNFAGLTASTPAMAAYSLRLLSNGYSGNAIQVRRNIDNSILDIGFTVGGFLDTTSLKTFVGANSGFVTIWYDQSGNGRNLAQATTNSQPAIINSGVIYYRNGRPAIYHDNANDGFEYSNDYLTTTPLSVNLIAGSNSTSTAFRRAVQGTNNWLVGPYSNTHSWFANNWNHQEVTQWSLTNAEIFTVIEPTATANSSWRNGASQTCNNNKGVPNRIQTGAKGAYAEPLDGFISEIIVFNSDISSERTILEFNQGNFYSIAISGPITKNGNYAANVTNYIDRNGKVGNGGIFRTGATYSNASLSSISITTTVASSITITGAQSGLSISSDGGANISAGVCYDTISNPTVADAKTNDAGAAGTFTSSISNLVGNTTYYVRAYATNSQGTVYGNEISFTTLPPVLPSLSTTVASSVNGASASSGGNITSDGGATVTARGICWSTTSGPTTADFTTSNGTGIGTFTSSITGLSLATTYYARAYATNSAGTAYGNEISFTTNATLSVGEPYQGGIIAYFFVSGDPGYVDGETHGIIVATINQSASARWYNTTFTTTTATGTAIGTGSSNTTKIITSQGNTGTYAARLCRNYAGGG
jgi:hypothetical protein